MSRRTVTVFYHYGGTVVEDQILGVAYQGGSQGVQRVKTGTKYHSLVRKLHELTGIDSSVEKMVLSCRYPTLVWNGNCTFVRMSVHCDDSVDAMLSVVADNPYLNAVYLFIEAIPIVQYPQTENNPPHEHNYRYNDEPSSSYNPIEHHVVLSSQYQNNDYVLPTQPSQPHSHSQYQSHPNPIPQSPLVNVVEMLRQSRIDEPVDAEDAETENSDDVEMAQVDHEINALGGDMNEGTTTGGPERLYTPLAYYTTPQEDAYGPNHDWETPPDYRDRSIFYPKKDQLKKGLLFRSKEAVQNAVKMFSIISKREFTVRKSSKSAWEVLCMHADTGCYWRLRASIQQKHGMWEIVTYPSPHTCVYESLTADHAQISSEMIAGLVASLVKNDPSYKISNIIVFIKDQHEFTVGYYKAWKAKQKAIAMIFGDWETSYRILPKFLGAVRKYNPGSIIRYKKIDIGPRPEDTEVLDRVFFSFKPCIEGWKSCRPMICIDATHLYGRYKGKILLAVGKDANRQIFPLAFAYVDEESKSTWGWFLHLLRTEVVRDRTNVCVISDRHRGITAAINDPSNGWGPEYDSYHRWCIRHVRSNLVKIYPDEKLKDMFWRAATEFQVRKFDAVMLEMKAYNEEAWAYCMNLPLHMWTLCHDGGHRYGETTSNCAEVFNAVLKAARSLPITAAVQVIFYKLVQNFMLARVDATRPTPPATLPITPQMLEKYSRYKDRAGRHMVTWFNRTTGEAELTSCHGNRYAVLLSENSCSCGKWNITKIPCSHVVAICNKVNLSVIQYFSPFYRRQAWSQNYAPEFHPLHHEDYWDEPEGPIWIPNWKLKRAKGRPKENRFFNEMDVRPNLSKKNCGICGVPGHTRKTCPPRPTSSVTRNMHRVYYPIFCL